MPPPLVVGAKKKKKRLVGIGLNHCQCSYETQLKCSGEHAWWRWLFFVGTKLTFYFLVSPCRKSPKKSTRKERFSYFQSKTFKEHT